MHLYGRVITRISASSKARKGILRLSKKTGQYRSLLQHNVDQALNELNMGNAQTTIDTCGIFLTLAPKEAVIHNLLGRAYFSIEQLAQAKTHFEISIKLDPKNFESMNNLGSIFLRRRQYDQAYAIFSRSIKANPRYAQAHHNLAVVLEKLGKVEQALESIDRSLSISGMHPIPAKTKSFLLRSSNQPQEAIRFLKQALEKYPTSVPLLSELGSMYAMVGESDAARDILEDLVMLDKSVWLTSFDNLLEYCVAFLALARLKKFTSTDVLLQRLFEVRKLPECTGEAAISIDFALGKALEDIGQYEQSFKHYFDGSIEKRKADYPYTTQRRLTEVGQIKSEFVKSQESGNDFQSPRPESPIFIVGMPRSGTSLVEQIISSHSQIFGAGELILFNRFGKKNIDNLANIPANVLSEFAENYIESTLKLSDGEARFTDKLPMNFNWIGFIKSLFPNAKIIYMKRDPRDICLSNFKNLYAADALQFSYDLVEIAEYYLTYQDLMKYWNKAFPGEIYQCSYEALVADQESETRKLLAYCDLEWEDAALSFHKNKRLVKTASLGQVTQTLYSSSVAKWKRYEAQLQPAIDVLQAGGAL